MGQEPIAAMRERGDTPVFHNDLRPAVVSPPGSLLKRELVARGFKQTEFAKLIRRPNQFVSDLIRGKRELTVDTAMRLEAALGVDAEFWLRLEQRYRVYKFEQDKKLLESIKRDAEKRFVSL